MSTPAASQAGQELNKTALARMRWRCSRRGTREMCLLMEAWFDQLNIADLELATPVASLERVLAVADSSLVKVAEAVSLGTQQDLRAVVHKLAAAEAETTPVFAAAVPFGELAQVLDDPGALQVLTALCAFIAHRQQPA